MLQLSVAVLLTCSLAVVTRSSHLDMTNLVITRLIRDAAGGSR